jgi:hypothetical protein
MIREYLDKALTIEQKQLIDWTSKTTQDLLTQINSSIVTGTYEIGLPYWSQKNPVLVKNFTWLMTKLNIGTTKVARNFSNFQLNIGIFDPADILVYRAKKKIEKMALRYDDRIYSDSLVSRPSGLKTDGVPRPNMLRTAKNGFAIDREMVKKYRRPILKNMVKSIAKGIELGHIKQKFFSDRASYYEIANLLLDKYSNEDRIYNSEYNKQDQRGRAIKNILKRVGNYISNKDFRALIIVPKEQAIMIGKDSVKELTDIYLFIAELTGNKCLGQPIEAKVIAGKNAYLNKDLPRLNLKSPEGRKDLHELIWLERIYQKLDYVHSKFNKGQVLWEVPIEIDFGMSVAQIMGALTNDKRILESTSVLGDTLSDPWFMEGVRRNSAKAYGTPTLYGSSQTALSLLKTKRQLFEQMLLESNKTATEAEIQAAKAKSKKEIILIKKEFTTGRFSVMKQFKDLLIQNYTVQTPVISIDTGVSQFKVEVSHFKTVGVRTVVTEAYDGKKFKYSFTKEPIKVPDYKRMKLYWATAIIHHLDSDLMEYLLGQFKSHWALDIHDAILCLPGHATDFKEEAAKRLKFYNKNRYSIVQNYRKSIGATSPKADMQYIKLLASIVEAEDVPFKTTLMK